ncbi:MAG: aminotransferase class III-fold pyridoxal phosphate-dependent enzyme, partial [Rhodospirillaceae bacterium]
RGFHGSGLMTGSLTGLEFFHKAFDLPLSRVLHTEAPYYFHRPDRDMSESDFSAWCAERLEALILDEGPDTIAAFFGEPMLGTGGLVPPPEGYWPRIQAVLKKYDILFVADEVITGFGRLGTPFGSHFYGLQPDLITIAKGLTSAYAPLSGAVISKKVFSVLAEGTDSMGPFGHGLTYSAHPIGAAAGVANLSLIDDLGLMDNARKVGTYLRNQVREALEDHPHVGEIRGEGLTCAIELVENRDGPVFYAPVGSVAPKIAAAALRRGVIVRAMPHGDIIGIAPPFSLTRDEADSIVTAVVGAIHEILG